MCRCLLYMNDVELSLMDKEVTGVDESEDVLNLVESGYAGATYMGAVYVPEDVKAAYCKNCDEEWKEERKRYRISFSISTPAQSCMESAP